MHENSEDLKVISTDALVIGAGISGLTTALELAETGFKVVLIEKNPYVGGRVAQLNHYFPKLCPPSCGLEINIKRLRDNPNIELFTLAEVLSVEGDSGKYRVKTRIKPRYVKENCTNTEKYSEEIKFERDNDFNYGMDKTKILYLPYNNAYPAKFIFDKDSCPPEQLKYFSEAYKDCIDLEQKEEILEIQAKSIVWATGWDPYDAKKLDILGYKQFSEVITNVEMERLASPSGPTGGKILIPGTQTEPKKIAFVQCAGSRDENHLEYCSSVCCLASMKQAHYIREQVPDSEVHIFYIDIRSYGIYEEFYMNTKKDDKIYFHRGKVAKVFKPLNSPPEWGHGEKSPLERGQRGVLIEAEDTMAGELTQMSVDMVVLATGMQPTTAKIPQIDESLLDRNGFIKSDLDNGIIGCGVCTRPKDVAGVVQEATAAAMKAIHTIKGGR